MFKYFKEPHVEYVLSLNGNYHRSRKVAVEWYVTESNVLSLIRYRRDARYACTNCSLEQALEDFPNHSILKEMIEINAMYADQKLPPLILLIVKEWSNSYLCTRTQR